MKFFIALLFSISISRFAFAQAPQKFNYQGVARDNNGVALENKSISVRINILDVSATGPSLYSEKHAVTTNQFGLFNLLIGGGTSLSGSFSSINWGLNSKFVKVDLDINGGSNFKELGTVQFSSVPYAIYAQKAGYSEKSGQAEKAMYSKNAAYADSAIYAENAGYAEVAGSTVNETWKKSEIGINTPSPVINTFLQYSQHSLITNTSTAGGVAIALDRSNNVNDSQLRLSTGNVANTNSNHWSIGLDSNPTIYKNDLTFKYGLNNSNPHFVVKESGNVGIGTTTDFNSRFQVKGGNIYLEDVAAGVILKSPNGNCWKVTVDNSGQLIRTAITCP